MERQNAMLDAWLARHAPAGIASMADHIGDLLVENAAVTRAEPGAVWILRSLHASPQLVPVRLESHRHVAHRLVDAKTEERRVRQEGGSTGRSRWSSYH